MGQALLQKVRKALLVKYLSVDKFKCIRCAACVAVCPIKIIKLDPVSRLPEMVSKGEKICLRCGHCISVCPHRALSLYHMRAQDHHPLRHDWRLTPEKVEGILKGRRSIRNYKNEPVEKDKLKKIIEAARYAPSGINRQPVRWEIIYYKERVRRFSEAAISWMRQQMRMESPLARTIRMKRIVAAWDNHNDWICRGAPHLVIVYAPKSDISVAQDCTIALTYFELAAASAHLGTCWAGYAQLAINMSPEVRKFVYLSSRMRCFGAMLVGYPRFSYHRIPIRNKPHIIWR
jgi:nitroreductase/NAD-dependent dihydropyrimidine dehydrogenase PreA subunit